MKWLVVLASLTACAGYQPGSFQDGPTPLPASRTHLGCVDVAAEASPQPIEQPVVAIVIANGCDRAQLIDLGAVRLRLARGIELAPFDPRGEIRPLRLEARRVARVVVAFGDDDAPARDLEAAGRNSCLRLDGLVSDVVSPSTLCLRNAARLAELDR